MPDPSSISYMEWYFDDLVVPRDQELLMLERLPSPNSWSQGGASSASESNSGSSNNYKGKQNPYNKMVDMDLSTAASEPGNYSNLTASSCHGFWESSHEKTAIPYEGMDQELNHLAGINQMDDILLSSWLEEEPIGMDYICGSCNYFPEFPYGVSLTDNLFTDTTMESERDPNYSFGMGCSNSLKTWGEEEVASLHIPHCSEQNDNTAVKALLEKVSDSETMNGNVNKESSLELSVLQELEKVMAQLPVKTRICLRDALYRLANNSKQHLMGNSQNGDLSPERPPPPTTVHDETLRLDNMKNREAKTNAIDRAVANLMFRKMNSEVQDCANLPASGLLNFKQEAKGWTGQWRSCLAGDSEVPIVGYAK